MSPIPAILKHNRKLRSNLAADLRIPFRPNFRSVSPEKPETFRSPKNARIDNLNVESDDAGWRIPPTFCEGILIERIGLEEPVDTGQDDR